MGATPCCDPYDSLQRQICIITTRTFQFDIGTYMGNFLKDRSNALIVSGTKKCREPRLDDSTTSSFQRDPPYAASSGLRLFQHHCQYSTWKWIPLKPNLGASQTTRPIRMKRESGCMCLSEFIQHSPFFWLHPSSFGGVNTNRREKMLWQELLFTTSGTNSLLLKLITGRMHQKDIYKIRRCPAAISNPTPFKIQEYSNQCSHLWGRGRLLFDICFEASIG